jgi:hypothetical protein
MGEGIIFLGQIAAIMGRATSKGPALLDLWLSCSLSFFIGKVLARFSYAEKLTVMFSV